MRRLELSLPGICQLRPRIIRDQRGFFLETYHAADFVDLGITDTFVQDNHSKSSLGVIRGLHYQLKSPQAKLCRVIEGKALDVTVDIRVGSPHFGEWTSLVLSAEEQNQIFIPGGFAHGFLALEPDTQFLYKCSRYYDPSEDLGIAWNDPDIGIAWGAAQPLVSKRDASLPTLNSISREFLPVYSPQ